MKYYPPVLVILRFFAFSLFAYATYAIIAALTSSYPDAVMRDEGVAKMIEMTRNQSIKGSVGYIIGSTLLYFLAPLFARIITIGSGSNQR